MRKLIFITTIIFGFSFHAVGAAKSAAVSIRLSSTVNVTVTGEIARLNVVERLDKSGFDIKEAAIPVKDLKAGNFAIKMALRGKTMLNLKNFPLVMANEIRCYYRGKYCTGTLTIKGNTRAISMAKLVGTAATNKQINFSFLLSDYDIARSILGFDIDNTAEATIDISK